MRLWNLVTGAKAGVLEFDRGTLAKLNGGKKDLGWREGEGRKIVWRDDGEEFAIAFDRGVLVLGLDCVVRGYLALGAHKKVGQIGYLPFASAEQCSSVDSKETSDLDVEKKGTQSILALSTEDGRFLFYDTRTEKLASVTNAPGNVEKNVENEIQSIPALGELAIPSAKARSRVKDFVILPIPTTPDAGPQVYICAACSDGRVHLFVVNPAHLRSDGRHDGIIDTSASMPNGSANLALEEQTRKVGKLLGTYETGHRITCLTAFLHDGVQTEAEDEASTGHQESEAEQEEFNGIED